MNTNNANNLVIFDDKLIELNAENYIVNIADTKNLTKFNFGDIYIGKVMRLIKSMEIAYVDIGDEKNGFLPKKNWITSHKNLMEGEYIVVQIVREAIDNKGVILTQKISLANDLLVYFPQQNFNNFNISISKKIVDNNVRKKVKNTIKNLLENKNLGDYFGSFIIRSNNKNIDAINAINLKNAINELIQIWQKIKENAFKKSVPNLIYNFYQHKIQHYLAKFEKVYTDKTEIFIRFENLKTQLENLKNNIVYLVNGSNLIIEKTSALTIIDVNSGKVKDETILQINKLATIEILRQIKLRNIGGIIIIDFIKMHDLNNQNIIVELLKKEAIKDNQRCQILGFTNAGLCEIIRQKTQNEINFEINLD